MEIQLVPIRFTTQMNEFRKWCYFACHIWIQTDLNIIPNPMFFYQILTVYLFCTHNWASTTNLLLLFQFSSNKNSIIIFGYCFWRFDNLNFIIYVRKCIYRYKCFVMKTKELNWNWNWHCKMNMQNKYSFCLRSVASFYCFFRSIFVCHSSFGSEMVCSVCAGFSHSNREYFIPP